MYYQNVNGLRSKLKDIQLAFSLCVHDVVVLSESNLMPDICDSELGAHGFNVFRMDRSSDTSSKQSGGGILIAIRNTLTSFRIPTSIDNVEYLTISCRIKHNVKLLICGTYIPPNSGTSLYSDFCTAVEEAASSDSFSSIIILGDFNLPNVSWESLSTGSDSAPHPLVDLLHTFGLSQVNRVSNFRGVSLDLVFANPTTVVSHTTAPWIPEDRHHPALEIDIPSQDPHVVAVKQILNFKRCNTLGVLRELAAADLLTGPDNKTTDQKFSHLVNTVKAAVLSNTPVRRFGLSYPPWFSPELKSLVTKKKLLHIQYKKTLNPVAYNSFSAVRAQCKDLASLCFDNYISHIQDVLPHNPKIFWSFVSSIRGNSATSPSAMTRNGVVLVEDKEKCDAFADFFSSVFEPPLDLPLHSSYINSNCLSGCEFSYDEVKKILGSLDITKGCGPDSIPPIVLQNCRSILSYPLQRLFNESVRSGVFPDVLKCSYIVPIHKSGSTSDINNYRPIAIQPTIAKIFEKLVLSRVFPLLRSSLSPNQHGFMPGRSTSSNLVMLQSHIVSSFKAKKQVDVLYLDFSKAFDRVCHSLLVKKLEASGIHGQLLLWFKSYLQDRKLIVKFGSETSSVFTATSGVPQGSHLGPILFNVFVNDLTHILKTQHLLFADDVKLYSSVSSLVDCISLQNNLEMIEDWCELNGMKLNLEKCTCITFHKIKTPIMFSYKLYETNLERVNIVKDLGVTLSSSLGSQPHIVRACAKANKHLGLIFRASRFIRQPAALKVLYISYVRPHLEFSSVVWFPHQRYLVEMINRVQTRFLRIVGLRLNYCFRDVPVNMIATQLYLPSLELRRDIQDIVFLYKVVNGLIDCPPLLELVDFRMPSGTRNTELFARHHHGSIYELNSPMVRIQHKANRLPPDIDFFHSTIPGIRKHLLMNAKEDET